MGGGAIIDGVRKLKTELIKGAARSKEEQEKIKRSVSLLLDVIHKIDQEFSLSKIKNARSISQVQIVKRKQTKTSEIKLYNKGYAAFFPPSDFSFANGLF